MKKSKIKTLSALTFDVEDGLSIYCRDLLGRKIEVTENVSLDTMWLLEVLAEFDVRASFYILGNVAVKFRELIKKISDYGHEIGIHGFSHKQLFNLSPRQFRSEISDAKKLLEDIISLEIKGHRAPAFSVMPNTSWSFDIIAQEGFMYDSSIAPCKNARYGWPGFSKDICNIQLDGGLSLIEVPMTVINLPLSNKAFLTGGGYLRLFPYLLSSLIIKYIQRKRPIIMYMHPYEFGGFKEFGAFRDLDEDEINNLRSLLRKATMNIHSMPLKLKRLLSDFEFTTTEQIIKYKTEADEIRTVDYKELLR